MTDFTGKEEPAATDEQAADGPAPIIPIGPGAAGVVALPVARVDGEPDPGVDGAPDRGAPHGEPLPWMDDEEPAEPAEHHRGIGDAIRGLLRHDKVR
jgi:hypothetical protein